MKLLFLGLLVTTSALACPDLSGHYNVCKPLKGKMDQTENMTMTQTMDWGTEVYNMSATISKNGAPTSQSLKANGIPEVILTRDPRSGISTEMTTTTTCDGDTLRVQVKAKLPGGLKLNVLTLMTKVDEKLKMEITGNFMTNPIEDTVICE